MKRIFITGASGCIGHYIVETLIQETDHELYLLVRNRKKLGFKDQVRPGIHILESDLKDIEKYTDLLQTMDAAILTAAAWGGPQEVMDVNINKTIQLIQLLNPQQCQQVIYFSTASILGHDNQLLREAGEIGTDYIHSKYECMQRLSQLTEMPPITTLFPTLVLGGDTNKPYSHLSSGLSDVVKWMPLIRWFKADGSFHFIHSADIAKVVHYFIENPPHKNQQFVLGNPKVTADQVVEEACAYLKQKIYFRIPLALWLADVFIVLFRIQMAAWDRFCLNYRHFTYQNPLYPTRLGLEAYCPTIADVLKLSGVETPD